MIRNTLALTALLAFTMGAVAQTATPPATDTTTAQSAEQMTPADFVARATSSNMFEIESSNLALQMGVSAETQAFAEHMVADHTKAGEDMKPAAEAEGIEPPTALDPAHQQMLDSLAALEGEEFDAAYIDAQLKAHEEAVALFSSYAQSGPDGALKDFATATLPTLEEHLAHVQELTATM